MDSGVSGSGSGSGRAHAPTLPALQPPCSKSPPCPKSPPPYPDLYGKRREMARVQMLEREKSFLEEELKFVEGLQPASRCCKEIVDFVTANGDPLIATNRKISKYRRFWKWICGPCLSCFHCLWICCCPSCSIHLKWPQCCSCSCCKIPNCCSCFRCSLPKCSCWFNSFSFRDCCNYNPCSCPKIRCCSLKPLKSLFCSDCCSCSCKCTCSCPKCSDMCSCPPYPRCSCPPYPKCSCSRPKCSGVCACFRCIKDCCCYPCSCICCC